MLLSTNRLRLVFSLGCSWYSQGVSATTIYLCGDSTMALGTPPQKDGWGDYLQPLVNSNVKVFNRAIGGRSMRSYWDEGRFNATARLVKPGDLVVIEFGHNDGGCLPSPKDSRCTTDNGRSDCVGSGSEVCTFTFRGEKRTVQTFVTYAVNAGKQFVDRGAQVIFSSQTPNNLCEKDKDKDRDRDRRLCLMPPPPNRFVDYAIKAAKLVGPKASFIDHYTAVADVYHQLGAQKVRSYYPQDHTHTNAAGAAVVAKAFVDAALRAKSPVAAFVKNRA
jgi:rhamnogalacturonan acetylesterase